jgi:hypothetical protein
MPPLFPIFNEGNGEGVKESTNIIRMIKAINFLLPSSSVSISKGSG